MNVSNRKGSFVNVLQTILVSLTTSAICLSGAEAAQASPSRTSLSVEKPRESQPKLAKRKRISTRSIRQRISSHSANERHFRNSMSPAPVSADTLRSAQASPIRSSGRGAGRSAAGLQISTAPSMTLASATSSITTVPVTQSVTSVKTSMPETASPGYGGDFTNTLTTSMYETGSSRSTQSWDVEFLPWVNLGAGFKADLAAAVSKDLTQERKSSLQNTTVGLSYEPMLLGGAFKYRPKVAVQLPTGVEANKTSSFRSSLSLQNRFLFAPPALKGFTSYYQLSVNRHFYEYTTTGDGESNTEWALQHRITITYAITDSLSIAGGPTLQTKYTFSGTPTTFFRHLEELTYTFNPQWSLSLGHDNEGGFYKENGRDANLAVVNKDQSKLYVGVGYAF